MARLPRSVVALGFASLFTDASSEMIVPLLPAFLTEVLGGSAALLGAVEGAADTVASLVKLWSGSLADRLSRRKPLVVAGYSISSAARPLMAMAGAAWHVFAVRIADRIGKGIRSAPRDALLADAAPEGRAGAAFGLNRAMDHAGAVIGPVAAAGLLAAGMSLRGIFWLAAIPAALALLAFLFVRETPREVAIPGAREAFSPTLAWSSLPPAARSWLLILLAFNLGHATDAFLLLRARELGIGLAMLPLLWAAFHVSKSLTSLVAGTMSDRFGRPRLILGGWAVSAAAFGGFALATEPWHAWALLVGYGTYHGLTEPAEKALVRDLVPADMRGRAFGVYNFVVGIAALPAGLAIGFLWTHAGGIAALGASAAVTLACAALFLAWTARWRDALRTSPSSPG